MSIASPPADVRPDVAVRLVRPDELAAAGTVLVTAYEHDYTLSDSYRAQIEDVRRWAGDHELWVAVDPVADAPGTVLGVVVTPRPDGTPLSPLTLDGELDFRLLAVHPDARGRGVGEVLVRHVVQTARARGATRVVMSSGPQMLAAHRLYARLGFRRLPERETRVVEGDVRLLAFALDL